MSKSRQLVVLLILLLLTIFADIVLVEKGVASKLIAVHLWLYHVPFWVLIWLVCFLYFGFFKSVAAVIALSTFEDAGYWLLNSWFTGKPWLPIDDTWAIGNFGIVGQWYSTVWFGLPAGYYIMLGIAGVVYYLGTKRRLKHHALSPKGYSWGLILASLVLTVILGSYLPDIDHFLAFPYQIHYASISKGYGHVIYFYLGMAVLSGWGIAHFSGYLRPRILREEAKC